MKILFLILAVVGFSFFPVNALKASEQGIHVSEGDSLPYYEIPEYPREFTAGTVAARMIDGLGFRFYWATSQLKQADLDYRPVEGTRTVAETIDHIYQMSILIARAVDITGEEYDEQLGFTEKRSRTLQNLNDTREVLIHSTGKDLEEYIIEFRSGAKFPFWNLVNGPIADCIWHCGQIASFRRVTGNPFNEQVSHFSGKVIGR